MSERIQAELVARMASAGHLHESIVIALGYSADDLWAVTADFWKGPVCQRWIFGRELLADAVIAEPGFHNAVGLMDLMFFREDDQTLVMVLRPGEEDEGRFLLPLAAVVSFLDRTLGIFLATYDDDIPDELIYAMADEALDSDFEEDDDEGAC